MKTSKSVVYLTLVLAAGTVTACTSSDDDRPEKTPESSPLEELAPLGDPGTPSAITLGGKPGGLKHCSSELQIRSARTPRFSTASTGSPIVATPSSAPRTARTTEMATSRAALASRSPNARTRARARTTILLPIMRHTGRLPDCSARHRGVCVERRARGEAPGVPRQLTSPPPSATHRAPRLSSPSRPWTLLSFGFPTACRPRGRFPEQISPLPVFVGLRMPFARRSSTSNNPTRGSGSGAHASGSCRRNADGRGHSGYEMAFATLARRHSARLIAYCMQFTKKASAAEEIAQDTWLGLWSSRTGYEPTVKFVVLLFVAARIGVAISTAGTSALCDGARAAERGRRRCTCQHDTFRARTDARVGASKRTLGVRRPALSGSSRKRSYCASSISSRTPNGAILHVPEATARSRVHLAIQKLRELGRKEILR